MKITDKDRINFIQDIIKNDAGLSLSKTSEGVEIFTTPAQHQSAKTVRDVIDKAMEYGVEEEDWGDE